MNGHLCSTCCSRKFHSKSRKRDTVPVATILAADGVGNLSVWPELVLVLNCVVVSAIA